MESLHQKKFFRIASKIAFEKISSGPFSPTGPFKKVEADYEIECDLPCGVAGEILVVAGFAPGDAQEMGMGPCNDALVGVQVGNVRALYHPEEHEMGYPFAHGGTESEFDMKIVSLFGVGLSDSDSMNLQNILTGTPAWDKLENGLRKKLESESDNDF